LAADRPIEAAAVADEVEVRPAAAVLRFAAAEALARDGRVGEARGQLGKAIDFWRSVGATHYLAKAEALAASLGEGRIREGRAARA